MKDNSSKQILLSVLGVAILVVAVVGVSFAAFTYSKAGTVENVVSTGAITLTYTEGATGISITDAMPMTEAAGKALHAEGQYFDFKVAATVTGTTTINYDITASKVTDGTNASTLSNSDVRLYLEELASEGASAETAGTVAMVPTAFTPGTVNDLTGRPAGEMVLKSGQFTASDTTFYRLRMWLDKDYGKDDTTGESFATAKKFTVKVNVYAKQA